MNAIVIPPDYIPGTGYDDFVFDPSLHDEALNFADKVLERIDPTTPAGRALFQLALAYSDLRAKRGLPPILKCGPQILLASGVWFDFLDPENSPMPVEDIASALSKIARFGGFTFTDKAYPVAQHLVLASRAAPAPFKYEALMHDAPEAFYGDWVTPLKQLFPDAHRVFKRIDDTFNRRYLLPLEMSPEVHEVDQRMFATERRDLQLPDPPGEPGHLTHVKPYDIIIEPWSPATARQRWLAAFDALKPEGLEIDG